MTRLRRPRTLAATLALLLALGTSLAACSSSSPSSTGGSAGSDTAAGSASSDSAASSSSSGAQPLVTLKDDPKLGSILADSTGHTLYTLTKDGQAVDCTGGCLTVWPPLVAPAGVTTPTGAKGVPALTIVAAPDGTKLVAAGGLPLYRFAKDTDKGDAYGEGISSFGGVWHVVKAGAGSSGGSTSTDSSTSSSSDTGSGTTGY
jgi:predicted lipoprotein with Yx(FWY)xxD motif